MSKEIVVLTNNIKESEKLKSIASFGVSTFNTRFFNSLELAKYLLQISGVAMTKEYLSSDQLAAFIYTKIKAISYCKDFSFSDVVALINSLTDLRYYIVDNEEELIKEKLPQGIFKEKNAMLIQAYDLIIRTLGNQYIDEIGLIRYAFENTKVFNNISFVIYERNNLKPLEKELINKAAGKIVVPTQVDETSSLVIERYTKAFGQTNEIEDILSYIYENNIPFDQCLIASTETKDYATILINYRDTLNLPITIGVGRTILQTAPGKMFSLIENWMNGYYHLEFFVNLLKDESFNIEKFKQDAEIPDSFDEDNTKLDYDHRISFEKIVDIIGRMKMSFDVEKNNAKLVKYKNLIETKERIKEEIEDTKSRLVSLKYVERIVNILNQGLNNFISQYAITRDEKADSDALRKITKYLSYIPYDVPLVDIFKLIKNLNVGKESPEPGSLYFTSINNAKSCLRKHTFIVGLSSNNFPGKSVENPMILDLDYDFFDIKEASNRTINDNKNDYFSLLSEIQKYAGHVYISYAKYNSITLKDQNASSVIFETYKLENGSEKTLSDFEDEFKKNKEKYRFIEYFNSGLMPMTNIGRVLVNNEKISCSPVEESSIDDDVAVKRLIERNNKKGFSASTITKYVECPYLFYLIYVLGVEQEKDIDVFEIIPPNEMGTLVHSLLEHLDKNQVKNKAEFLLAASQKFDEYFVMNPSENIALVEMERKNFLSMMGNAYEMEDNALTAFKEEDKSCLHEESGIRIHGFPDKVIKNNDGTYRVIDYKTGKRIKHDVEDIESMTQCTIYSYIIEHVFKNAKVTSFEYWYLNAKKKIYSTDNEHDMKYHYDNLSVTLKAFSESINKGSFEPDFDHCKDCYYKAVCPRSKK